MTNFIRNISINLISASTFMASAMDVMDQRNLENESGYYNYGQSVLQEKIASYLTLSLNQLTADVCINKAPQQVLEDIKNRTQIIDYFKNSRGECAGLCALWAYGHFLQDQPNPNQLERDDLTNFHKLYMRFITWDGKTPFSPEEQKQNDRFIANIRLYQMNSLELFPDATTSQLNLPALLQDTKRGFPHLKFTFPDAFLSKEMFSWRLRQVIKPGTMIFLGTKRHDKAHVMSAYQSVTNGSMFFYDPNSYHGDRKVNQLEDLIHSFWEASDPSNFIPGFGGLDLMSFIGRTVSIDIFSFPLYSSDTYPPYRDFCVTGNEVVDLFLNKPALLRQFNTIEIINLLGSLGEDALFDILTYKIGSNLHVLQKLDHEERLSSLKDEITNCYIKSVKLQKKVVIHQLEQFVFSMGAVTTNQLRIISDLTSRAYALKDILSLTDIIVTLATNPGNNVLVQELFDTFLKSNPDKNSKESAGRELSQNRNSSYINAAIISNIEIGSIDTSKTIIKYLADNFGVFPTLGNVKNWHSVELSNFIIQEFSEYYKDEPDLLQRIISWGI